MANETLGLWPPSCQALVGVAKHAAVVMLAGVLWSQVVVVAASVGVGVAVRLSVVAAAAVVAAQGAAIEEGRTMLARSPPEWHSAAPRTRGVAAAAGEAGAAAPAPLWTGVGQQQRCPRAARRLDLAGPNCGRIALHRAPHRAAPAPATWHKPMGSDVLNGRLQRQTRKPWPGGISPPRPAIHPKTLTATLLCLLLLTQQPLPV